MPEDVGGAAVGGHGGEGLADWQADSLGPLDPVRVAPDVQGGRACAEVDLGLRLHRGEELELRRLVGHLGQCGHGVVDIVCGTIGQVGRDDALVARRLAPGDAHLHAVPGVGQPRARGGLRDPSARLGEGARVQVEAAAAAGEGGARRGVRVLVGGGLGGATGAGGDGGGADAAGAGAARGELARDGRDVFAVLVPPQRLVAVVIELDDEARRGSLRGGVGVERAVWQAREAELLGVLTLGSEALHGAPNGVDPVGRGEAKVVVAAVAGDSGGARGRGRVAAVVARGGKIGELPNVRALVLRWARCRVRPDHKDRARQVVHSDARRSLVGPRHARAADVLHLRLRPRAVDGVACVVPGDALGGVLHHEHVLVGAKRLQEASAGGVLHPVQDRGV
mmetsp:Transcript_60305/g.148322  ORF Transcript_60305/g.148322 Transcript_60305/m.148322 type:complete len:394 (-) Transcript_60305:2347-3528(-)